MTDSAVCSPSGKVYETYQSHPRFGFCLGMQGGRGMEVTPLALTSTSVADQFPVGRQLHQVEASICCSPMTCHIVISGRSYNQILHHSQSQSPQSAHSHRWPILTVSSSSQLAHAHSQHHSQSSSSHVQAHAFAPPVQSLVPAMRTAMRTALLVPLVTASVVTKYHLHSNT